MPLMPTSAKNIFTYSRQLLFFILLFVLPVSVWTAQQVEKPPQSSDVRVLIDVSGSMKKNDPNNLRLPALRLLVGLLPPDSTAAVWNFGTKAEPLVALGLTNDKWKAGARQASKKIHSRDLLTNIGSALDAAIADWGQTPAELSQRSIILLTDGMIDISKDDAMNKQERARILETLLPKIADTGASIHTIALSANADDDFLKQLSTKTDGGFEQTDNAEQLERIFLRLFEKTTRRDTLPLVDNKFLVDDSILELTLLVFKAKNAQPSIVIDPDKKNYQLSNKPNHIKWQSEKNYDLITITRPKPGEWSINAQTDPDNRVMVVTNLQIQTSRIANNLFAGEILNIALFLTDNNKKIADDNFLQFISINAIQEEPNKKRWFLHDNGLRGDQEAHDGIYNVGVSKTLAIGNNQFTIQASSETFQREIKHSVIVHDTNLIHTRVDQIQKNNKNYHQILVTPNLEFVNARKMDISALLLQGEVLQGEVLPGEAPDNSDNSQPIKLLQTNPNVLEWSYESDTLDADKTNQIIIHMVTHTHSGRPINYTSRPILLSIPKFDNLPITPDQLLKDDTPPKEEKEQAQEPGIETTIEKISETEENNSHWLPGIIIAVIVNIILGTGGWFGFRKWKKSRETAYADITGELE